METTRNWVPYQEVNFEDPQFKTFSVDTRDFHCIALEKEPDEKLLTTKKLLDDPDKYVLTTEELKTLLDRYHQESGGPGQWRMLRLDGEAKERTSGWEMKYIRIFRVDKGFIICLRDTYSRNSDDLFIMGKHMLACSVDQMHLHHH